MIKRIAHHFVLPAIKKRTLRVLSFPFIKTLKPGLSKRISFSFVNIPISSKYYHVQFPTSLQLCFKMAEKEEKLNEKVYILQHIAEMVLNDPKLAGKKVNSFLIKQLKSWEGDCGGRFQRVATVAWIIRKMGLRKYVGDLYEEIIRRVDEDQWYVDFDESVKAIEAFSDYQDVEMRDKIFQKIERNLGISMGDVNMTYYQRICASLYEAGRYRSRVWDKLEHFVTRNLSMDYTPKTFFDIFKYFAITRNGTTEFYQICQDIIHRGHLYNSTFRLRNNTSDYDASGDYFAMMIETYAEVNKYTPFPLSSDFLDYLYKNLIASKIEFKDISSLTKIINNIEMLQFHETEVKKIVSDIIQNKQFTEYRSLTDIQALYFTMESKYKRIPQKLKANVERLVLKDLNRHLLPLPTAIETVQFVLSYHKDQDQQDKLAESPLFQSLNSTIERKYKYLEYEEKQIVIECLKTCKGAKQIEQKTVPERPMLPKPTQAS